MMIQMERQRNNQMRIQKLEDELEQQKIKKKSVESEDKLQKVEAAIRAIAQEVMLIKQNQKQAEIVVTNCIGQHPNNYHVTKYAVAQTNPNEARISRVGDNGCYNFVNKYEIKPDQKVRYSLRIVKSKVNSTFIGFCSQKGFGNLNNYMHSESVYYYTFGSGYLWEWGNNKSLSGGRSVTIGDVVQCVAYLIRGKFLWYKNGNFVVECNVPNELRNQSLFFSVLLEQEGEADIFI